ncbi:hypothetical protein HBI56_073670 [Parastagonospora nodorum]|uniref:Uncharacterized protein n=2 Tax=Phaeosphaeria nodorum (strain SN15 / ATCC MYA-4574 / FGSC 10173) TaxID=321614 RepID=A0A7U2HXP5_PHANO|nr:hypothetical protein SNOG_07746 [Parastagonospora nodorum SN15]KAH3908727.1 hypothetical protein HBH56_171310 [Parastagonospora nodorum]EAT85212.1 hypothetical protein SNOG_07746 [Parastagonospora nodorum SN15]KAH3928678.1 hypothetical protein HBH54_139870 [Parastagonospora nodorum]KAH3945474.1 hypothetical protein HBH53_145220 [Parastagonospora nodorum]KAH3983852.1 hypothetical protein HBH52_059000 [Parastagonospora nodorum]
MPWLSLGTQDSYQSLHSTIYIGFYHQQNLQFLPISTALDVLAFTAATPVPAGNVRALPVVKRTAFVPDNLIANLHPDSSSTDLIEHEDKPALRKRETKDVKAPSSRNSKYTMANRQVVFQITKLTYNTMRVVAKHLLERSITVYVTNNSFNKLDVFSTQLDVD